MRTILLFFFLATLLTGCQNSGNDKNTKSDPPNILLIFCDDLGYGDLAIHGNQDVYTPNIDRFAREAVRIDPFYAQPVCAPSRAQLLTGRHFLNTGIWHVYEERAHMNLNETTIAEVLHDAGYYTAFIGKWTLGRHGPYLPGNRGFVDSWREALEIDGNIYSHKDPQINVNGEIRKYNGWASVLYTDFALEAMEKASGKPFFIELAHISTHEPYYAPGSLIKKYTEKGLSESLATFYAMVEQLDQETGRMMDELDKRGLASNTVVIFTSDNGPIGNCQNLPNLTEEEMDRRNPLGLRGRKGNVFENGIRVPGFFRWPEHFPARIINYAGDLADLFPTLVELTGTTIPEGNLPIYGKSLVPLLTGKTDQLTERYLYFGNHQVNWQGRQDESGYLYDRDDLLFEGTNLAIRHADFKYVQFARAEQYGTRDQYSALYNLKEDIGEENDISKEQPGIRNLLENELKRWWTNEILNNSDSYNLPTYYLGYKDAREVEVHVGSAVNLYGDIDYRAVKWVLGLADWKGNGSGVDYRIKVLEKGPYEVLISLTPGETSAQLECSFGTQKPVYIDIYPGKPIIDKPAGIFDLEKGETILKLRLGNPDNNEEIVIKTLDSILIRRKD